MLLPKELDALPDRVTELYATLEEDIIKDMARRIIKTDFATETAQWQLIQLQRMSITRDEVFDRLSKATGKTKDELVDLFNEAAEKSFAREDRAYRKAGYKTVPLAENAQLQKIINAGLRKTENLFDNLTSTTANTASRQFENALDAAYMQITSGAFDYNTAIRTCIRDLAQKGIAYITYPSGHTDYLDVAVRRSALTGVGQTCGEMQIALADEMDCDLVEVTAHNGARPEHAVWQGKVYSRSGKSTKYPDFVKSTGYGTGDGLKGWNCRHDFFPFFEGSEPAYTREELAEFENRKVTYNGVEMTEYEASQKQRAYERRIRATKRELAGYDAGINATDDESLKADLQAAFDRKSVILKKQEAAIKDFTHQTGLYRDRAREQSYGFNKSVSQKAIWANKNSIALKTENAQYKEYLYKLSNGEIALKEHQENILKQFENGKTFVVIKKRKVKLDDLAAFTAVTKAEFALFTKGKNVILLKGSYSSCTIPASLLQKLIDEKWIFTGHSHPTFTGLKASFADISVLKRFTWQKESRIIDLSGKTKPFTANEQDWFNELLGVKNGNI